MNVRDYSTRAATQQIYCTQKFTILVSDNTLLYIKRSHEHKKGAQILTIHPFLYINDKKTLEIIDRISKKEYLNFSKTSVGEAQNFCTW